MYGSRYQKKKTPYKLYFLLLILFVIAGFLVSGLYKQQGVTLYNLGDKMLEVLKHPFKIWNEKTPAIIGLAFIIWFLVINYFLYYYRNFQSSMIHGDEDWLDVKEATADLQDKDEKYNRILTESLRTSTRGGLSNQNMLVIGSSGSFKTTSLMHQNLLQMYGSYVVLDVKGDTQRKLGKKLQKLGATIKSVNFKQPEKSDRINPFVNIEREDDLLRVIKALHDACRPNKSASMADPFWDDAVDLYFKALFGYVWLDARDSGKTGTMNDVLYLCSLESQKIMNPDTEEEISKLQLLMDEKERKYGAEYPPVRDYRKLKEGASDTVSSVILMINGMLSVCETAEVKRIFSDNDINIREIGTGVGGNSNKPIVLFLVIPDQNPVYNWIISMYYTQIFDTLIRLSDDELHAPLPLSVEVWMDEFYAGAKPADADVLLGVVRSRNIAMIPMLQSVSQIKTLFKDDKWETIMDNTATVVFLGSGSAATSTHEFISKLLGEATADVRGDNVHQGSNGSSGIDFRREGVKMMTPGQVKRMPPTECIVFLESRPPIYDRKAIPFDKEDYNFKAINFLKDRYSQAFSLGAYEHPVYTVYDPIHFHYITVDREAKLKVLTDEKEIETYEEAAKNDPNIFIYNIEEKDLLYLNWDKQERSEKDIESMFKQALETEKKHMEDINGLAVLQDAEEDAQAYLVGARVNKATWDKEAPLKELLAWHWDELTKPEQEEVCLGLSDGLTEEQLKELLLTTVDAMDARRRAYALQNTAKG